MTISQTETTRVPSNSDPASHPTPFQSDSRDPPHIYLAIQLEPSEWTRLPSPSWRLLFVSLSLRAWDYGQWRLSQIVNFTINKVLRPKHPPPIILWDISLGKVPEPSHFSSVPLFRKRGGLNPELARLIGWHARIILVPWVRGSRAKDFDQTDDRGAGTAGTPVAWFR